MKLVLESKSFQVIRFVNVLYGDQPHPRNTKETQELARELIERINFHPEFSHYIDVFVKIESCHQLYSPSPRRFHKKRMKSWSDLPINQHTLMHPLYMLFCSCFNEGTDRLLRDALITTNSGGVVHLEPISYYAYGNFLYNENVIVSSELQNSKFALLLFQVLSPELIRDISKPINFFYHSPLNGKSLPGTFWVPMIYGLLRGDMEGFILFKCNGDADYKESANNLKKYLLKADNYRGGWFTQIAPILLYVGGWVRDFKCFSNIEILQALGRQEQTLKRA